MNRKGCWATWSPEEWRLLDRDGLVQILAQSGWQQRTDQVGRNVAQAALLHGCQSDMFDQLMSHALVDGGQDVLIVHEDGLGARLPAYALRHASRMETAYSSLWKDEIFARPGRFVNSRGLGVIGQSALLAHGTLHETSWLPSAEPLPVLDPALPAPGIRSALDWVGGLQEDAIDHYVANRLLVHIAGKPRSHAPDLDALESWVLPRYHQDLFSGNMDLWSPACRRMMRLVDTLGKMLGMIALGANPHMPFQAALCEAFEQMQPDLLPLLPRCANPDRHIVKWLLSEQRLDHLWDGLRLAATTDNAQADSDPRRL